MTDETRIALENYDRLIHIRGLDHVRLDWTTGTVVYGAGGANLDELCRPGFAMLRPPDDERPEEHPFPGSVW